MNYDRRHFMAAVRYLANEARRMNMPKVAAQLATILRLDKQETARAVPPPEPDDEPPRPKD